MTMCCGNFSGRAYSRTGPDNPDYQYHYLLRAAIQERKLLSRPTKSHHQVVREAVVWCVRAYKEFQEKGHKKINQRGIAREATERFFPYLRGRLRSNMIINLRISCVKKMKNRKRVTK